MNQVFFISFFDPIEQFAFMGTNITSLKIFSWTGPNLYLLGSALLLMWAFESSLSSSKSVLRFALQRLIFFTREIVLATITMHNQRYYLFLLFLFLLLLLNNLVGLLPYSYTVTSSLVYAFSMSIMAVGGITLIGFERFGLHFFDRFVPAGVPYVIISLLVVIEIISYVMRFFSLAIRLFANMVSGHILIKILISAAWYLLSTLSGLTVFAFIISALCLIIFVLELFIAFLQAYVFTFLTAVYLSEVIALK